MKNNLFEASDFDRGTVSGCDSADHCAEMANSLLPRLKKLWLKKLLRDAPIVSSPMHLENPSWTPKRHSKDTHTARLVCIEAIAKEAIPAKPTSDVETIAAIEEINPVKAILEEHREVFEDLAKKGD